MTENTEKVEDQHAHQRAYFDKAYAGYQEYKLENWRKSYLTRIFGDLRIPGPQGYKFLDVGIGGMGYTTIEAARLGAESWGIDLSQVAIESSRRLAVQVLDAEAAARCHFDLGPAETLPYADNSYDGVSCIAVLEHIVNDRQVLAQLVRVLKPGGRLYLVIPHSFSKTPWPLAILNWVNDKIVGHLRHYGREELATEMAALGAKEIKTVYHGHMAKFWQFLRGFVDKSMADPESPLWWKYEKQDLDAWQDERASMLSMVFEKNS